MAKNVSILNAIKILGNTKNCLQESFSKFSTSNGDKRFTTVHVGQKHTNSYKIYLKHNNKLLSPFHDVPLHSDKHLNRFNMIVEIPRWTNAKMEINKKEILNPITQDIKNDKLRFVNNVFPYHGYIWNYGAFPQTWEDPNKKDDITGCNGDNDPIDVCEIGSKIHKIGSVISVKILGALGLIDDGECDWKIIAIDEKDPLAEKLHSVNDLELHMPGLLHATRDWFRIYKIPTGKPANSFAAGGKFFDNKFAINTIKKDHEYWLNLIKGGYESNPKKKKGIILSNTALDFTGNLKIDDVEALKLLDLETESTSESVDEHLINNVHFVERNLNNLLS